jgi:hypothetical protein
MPEPVHIPDVPDDGEIIGILAEIARDPKSGAQARISAIRQLRQLQEAFGRLPADDSRRSEGLGALDSLEPRRRARGRKS